MLKQAAAAELGEKSTLKWPAIVTIFIHLPDFEVDCIIHIVFKLQQQK